MSDLFENHIAGFPMRRLICGVKIIPTHNINLGQFSLKQWLLKLGHSPHYRVILRHDHLQPGGSHPQLKRVGVPE